MNTICPKCNGALDCKWELFFDLIHYDDSRGYLTPAMEGDYVEFMCPTCGWTKTSKDLKDLVEFLKARRITYKFSTWEQ